MGARQGAVDPGHPDIIVIVVDTLRFDRTGLAPPSKGLTPHIRALAAGGTSFSLAMSHASWTLPATAALLTGAEGAADRTTVVAGVRTLFEEVEGLGYQRLAWSGNPLLTPETGLLRGAQVARVADAAGSGLAPWLADDLVTDALAGASAADGGKPLLLYLHLMDAHAPYLSSRASLAAAEPGWSAAAQPEAPRPVPWGKTGASPEQVQCLDTQRLAYDGEVAAVDLAIGSLLGRWPRGRPKIVALTADHGEALWSTPRTEEGWAPTDPPSPSDPDHAGWMRCRALLSGGYDEHADQFADEILHVPLVLVGPGVPEGRVEERLVATADLSPTLRRLLGVPSTTAGLPLGAGEPARNGVLSVGPRGVALTTENGRIIQADPRFAVEGRSSWVVPRPGRPAPDEQALEELLRSALDGRVQERGLPSAELAERLRALGYGGVLPTTP